MNIGKLLVGVILIAVGIWLFFTSTEPMVKYLGGIVLFVLGLVLLMAGFKKKDGGSTPPVGPTTPTGPTQ